MKSPGNIIGSRIKFGAERRSYRVRACNDRFAICTKPFNLRQTVLYTIIDYQRDVRGAEDLIFGYGFSSDEECAQALDRLSSGESGVSHRNCVPIDIQWIAA